MRRQFLLCSRFVVEIPNSHWLPHRLLLVRHGESEANVDRTLYSKMPDWKIPLTERGQAQALDCGRRLRNIIKNEKLYIYYSPYVRTQQTLAEIRKSLEESQVQGEREDERLREQEIGNFQPLEEMDRMWNERNEFGRFYYRFPGGESSVDVGDRVSTFFDSLFRERLELYSLSAMDPDGPLALPGEDDQNVLIISHGLLIRLFIARWFYVPVEAFETMRNPPNCSIVVLERRDSARLVMSDISKKLFGSDPLLEMMKFDSKDTIKQYCNMFFMDHSDSFTPEEGL
ncbi:glycerolphosphate mutase [Trypanosoma rangeli]|uniref:Glycerolphosphate mutase n=1 Tax=Trypanosoma rangeli TaxID=5698 RepID=A0A3R7RD97_TRYRA|nr:glycerolphosphate mutase [Trypanosoma rangeli]RNF00241.1 glycerolphosphate mutase [Trypanosoma rangeli]|eukprot:RNF00241.1 glycerolphosphate mutase [Trypanosoma rangeli]